MSPKGKDIGPNMELLTLKEVVIQIETVNNDILLFLFSIDINEPLRWSRNRPMTGRKTEYEERYLLTGATGILGSHIMAGLLLKGKTVVIAGRTSRSESLKQRIRKLLN
jgi:hypothetical protein